MNWQANYKATLRGTHEYSKALNRGDGKLPHVAQTVAANRGVSMTTQPTYSITPRQLNAMKAIADGHNIEVETFCELLHMDIADSELDEAGDNRDILTQKGWRLLRQIEVVQS